MSGRINHKKAGVHVAVKILRETAIGVPLQVAEATTTTEADGSWEVTLPRVVGDDRDKIDVDYSGGGAPTPNNQVILTGNGGPIEEASGWTGWTALDHGTALFEEGMLLAPCFQVGVLSYAVNGTPGTVAPNEFCESANVSLFEFPKRVHLSEAVTVTSNDNRAFGPADVENQEPNPAGGLVSLTVPVGEPEALSPLPSFVSALVPTGFPTCSAELAAQKVTCAGLREHEIYTLTDGAQKVSRESDEAGTVTTALAITGGDAVALSDAAKRTLTTLHVADLKVNIMGNSDVVASGTCSPDEYWGGPIRGPFASAESG